MPDVPKEDSEVVKKERPEPKALAVSEGPVLVQPSLYSASSSGAPIAIPKDTKTDTKDLKTTHHFDTQPTLQPELSSPQENDVSSSKETSQTLEPSEAEQPPNALDTQADGSIASSITEEDVSSTPSNLTTEAEGDLDVAKPINDTSDVPIEAKVEMKGTSCSKLSESAVLKAERTELQQPEPVAMGEMPKSVTDNEAVQILQADCAEIGPNEDECPPFTPPSSADVAESETIEPPKLEPSRASPEECEETCKALKEGSEPKEEQSLLAMAPSECEPHEDCDPSPAEAEVESNSVGDTYSSQPNDKPLTVSEEYGTITVSGSSNVTYHLEEYNTSLATADEDRAATIADDKSYHSTSEEIGQIKDD